MDREENYLNNLNIDLRTQEDIDKLLQEYESGKLTRDEYICLSWLAHSVTNSNGFKNGWEVRNKKLTK